MKFGWAFQKKKKKKKNLEINCTYIVNFKDQ